MPDAWRVARALVMRHGWNSTAYQILNPGMTRWYSRAGDAVAGFAAYAGVRVVAGAPVCAEERLESAAHELEADAAENGEKVLYFGAGSRLERAYARRGEFALVWLGAQPAWRPAEWDTIVRRKSSLRAQINRARNKHVIIEQWPSARARGSGELRHVLHEWLATRGLPPLGFMVEPDVLDLVDDRKIFVARRGRGVLGYLVASPIPARHGWLVEQWPRTVEAPNGTTHLLVDAAMRDFAATSAPYATLGLAPLSHDEQGLGSRSQPLWLRFMLNWIRAHGRRFYNFAGLEAFKASMQPAEWEPIYAIAPGGFTPNMLRAVAGVFSGGSPLALVARALGSALMQELHGQAGARRPA